MEKFNGMIKPKTMTKTFATSVLAIAVAANIQGCSSDDPDQGSSGFNSPISGAVIDGYLAGATVYVDLNNNAQRDVGEPKAITDKDGYFTTSKDGLVDYCASDASAAEARHCLRASYGAGDVILRIFGGYDLFTGEPFEGALSSKATALAGENIENQMITPLTSIVSQLSDTDRDALLGEYGLVSGDLTQDFLTNDGYTKERVGAALELHKIATIFAEVLEANYSEIGDHDDFPNDSFHLIYEALAQNIIGIGDLDAAGTNIDDAFDDAETAIRTLYTDLGLTPPGMSALRAQAITNAGKLLGVVEDLFETGSPSLDDAGDRALALELVTKKMTDDGADTAQIDATIAEAEDVSSDLFANLLDVADEVDFISLSQTTISGTTDFTSFEITNSQDLVGLPGQQIYLEYAEGGTVSGQGFFYFDGEANAGAGTLSVCLAYQDSSGDFEEETTGAYFDGDWFAIDENRLVLTFAGGYDITMVSRGLINESSVNERQKYTLNYGGDTLQWISADGLVDNSQGETEPTDDASCELLLESQPSIIPVT